MPGSGDGGRLRSPADLIAEKLESLELPELGEQHLDLTGRAAYFIARDPGGTNWTAAACQRCWYVGLRPAIPRKQIAFWECPAGHRYRLEPPLAVLAAGQRPILGDPRRGSLS
jgi:hypothetical protein